MLCITAIETFSHNTPREIRRHRRNRRWKTKSIFYIIDNESEMFGEIKANLFKGVRSIDNFFFFYKH